VQYYVKNVSARAIDGRGVLISLPKKNPSEGPVENGWIRIDGMAERHFDVDKNETFKVKIDVPPKSRPGTYKFRLDVVSVAMTDEGDEGQDVGFTVRNEMLPSPTNWPKLTLAVIMGLLVGTLIGWKIPRGTVPPPNPEPAQIVLNNYIGKQIGVAQTELTNKGLKTFLTQKIITKCPRGRLSNNGRKVPVR